MFDWFDDLDLGDVLETVGDIAAVVVTVVEAVQTVVETLGGEES